MLDLQPHTPGGKLNIKRQYSWEFVVDTVYHVQVNDVQLLMAWPPHQCYKLVQAECVLATLGVWNSVLLCSHVILGSGLENKSMKPGAHIS